MSPTTTSLRPAPGAIGAVLYALSLALTACAHTPLRRTPASACLQDFEARAASGLTLPAVERFSAAELACVFDAATEPVGLAVLAPSPGLHVFDGRNSLAVGRVFEKRFFATPAGVFGHNTSFFGTLFGSAGYFAVTEPGLLDYRAPALAGLRAEDVPAGAPKLAPNEKDGIFHDLVDVLRQVTPDVLVGRAERRTERGTEVLAHFVLLRRHPATLPVP